MAYQHNGVVSLGVACFDEFLKPFAKMLDKIGSEFDSGNRVYRGDESGINEDKVRKKLDTVANRIDDGFCNYLMKVFEGASVRAKKKKKKKKNQKNDSIFFISDPTAFSYRFCCFREIA